MCEKKWHVAMSGVLPHLYLDHILYRNITAAFLFFVVVLSTSGQTSVLTQHNDNARSGQNTSETILNTSDVNLNQFGKLFAMPSDGQVYAQPLYVPGVTINGAVHNVVIIATENDSVYAYDADSSGAPLWKASMVDAAHGAGGSGPETALNSATTTGCTDTQPQVGITSTPVIDPTSKTIYVEAKSTNGTNYFHRLHALDLLTGNEKTPGPVLIAATVSGTGDGSSNGQIVFNSNTNALYQLNRPGLLLLNGTIYIAYASHCDNTSHGWLFAYDEGTFTQKSVYVTTPNGGLGGFWMSGAGVAADASGNIFIPSGNGDFDMTSVPIETGDTILKLGTANQILTLLDYFTPQDQQSLDNGDQDLGSGGVLLLPDQPGSFPHILVEAGKEGRIYVVNRDQMTTNNSHYCSGCTNDPEIIEESSSGAVGGMFNVPAYWNNALYLWAVGDVLKSIPITNGLPDFTHITGSTPQIGFPGAGLSVSSNGTTPGSAIVWAINGTQYGSPGPGPGPAVLYAYDATNIPTMLYSSGQNATRDAAGNAVKFAVPTVANGKVYVGTSTEVDVYGLLPGVSGQTCPCTIWPSTATPGTADANQSQSIELGVKFTSSSSGSITGIRFYKGINNTGTHVGNLWSSTGTLLASATFTGESASGWQQVNFSSPVAITANTVYVASYFSPTGDFAVDRNYFNVATTSPPLQALQNGASGPNAVYNYGSSSAFPTTSFSASNYWVDVVFNGSTGTAPLTITTTSLAGGTQSVAYSQTLAATGGTQPYSWTLVSGSSLPAGLTLSSGGVISGTPTVQGTTSFTVQVTDASSPVQTTSAALSIAITGTAPLTITTTSLAGGTQSVAYSQTLAATGGTQPYSWTLVSGSSLPAGLTLSSGGVISGTPTVQGTTSFTVQVTDASKPALTANATLSITIAGSAPPPTCPCTIWPSTATPGTSDTNQSKPVELGVKFTSSSSGFITGVRFYKGVNNTGTHVGNLWSSTGTLLASATFTGESASGWQQVNFSSPVAITANTVYVASYFSPTGDFAVDRNYFNVATTNPPLQALQNGASGPNAVYNYGSSSAFPTTSFSASNYWVDVVFNGSGGSGGSGALTIWPSTATPGTSDTNQTNPVELGVKFTSSSSGFITGLRFYKGVNNTGTHVGNLWSSTGTLLANATFTGESAAGWQQVNFSPPVAITANTVYVASYFSPTGDFAVDRNYFNVAATNPPLQALQNGASGPNGVYNYGGSSAFPTTSFSASNYWVDVVFNSSGGSGALTIWPSTATPGTPDTNQTNPVELGVKFTSSSSGFITGIRFYKGVKNTGTHVGNLWSSTGTLLASAAFTGESASGWQQVNFSPPVAITANTVYVASYFSPTGDFAVDRNYFNVATTNPPLQALQNGASGPNGVYNYGSSSAFPTTSFSASNYWVDVVFSQ